MHRRLNGRDKTCRDAVLADPGATKRHRPPWVVQKGRRGNQKVSQEHRRREQKGKEARGAAMTGQDCGSVGPLGLGYDGDPWWSREVHQKGEEIPSAGFL